jgi:hypothetical protein
MGGYQLVFNYFEVKADKFVVQKIDSHHYSEADLVTIKIPLNMPYFKNESSFERYDGTIKINGVFYNYVKRKLSNDTLILQCIVNHEKTHLNKADNQYTNTFCSGQASTHRRTSGAVVKTIFLKYDFKESNDFPAPFLIEEPNYISLNVHSSYSCFIPLHIHPPQTGVA